MGSESVSDGEKNNGENHADKAKKSIVSEGESTELPSSCNQAQKQQSVWKVEETSSDGCTFLCPQLQSFNTSLPHQFVNTSQATTIVEHRCHISNNLDATISLNGKPIKGRTFSEFENDKQVGPLLDWVASLRFCIGYPDISLVENARYLQQKKIFLPPQVAKLLNLMKISLLEEIIQFHPRIKRQIFHLKQIQLSFRKRKKNSLVHYEPQAVDMLLETFRISVINVDCCRNP